MAGVLALRPHNADNRMALLHLYSGANATVDTGLLRCSCPGGAKLSAPKARFYFSGSCECRAMQGAEEFTRLPLVLGNTCKGRCRSCRYFMDLFVWFKMMVEGFGYEFAV